MRTAVGATARPKGEISSAVDTGVGAVLLVVVAAVATALATVQLRSLTLVEAD